MGLWNEWVLPSPLRCAREHNHGPQASTEVFPEFDDITFPMRRVFLRPDNRRSRNPTTKPAAASTGASVLCTADNSFLMHIGGIIRRLDADIRPLHIVEILAGTEEDPLT